MPSGVYTRPIVSIDDLFWPRVNKDGPAHPYLPELGPCWLWDGPIECGGYGAFRSRHHGRYQAHRLAWHLAEPQDDVVAVLHSCDNRRCVRNDSVGTYTINGIALTRRGHLFRGDRSINSTDKVLKGRQRSVGVRGSASRFAKLTEADIPVIIQMVRSGTRRRDVADIFHMGLTAIDDICARRTWQHVAID